MADLKDVELEEKNGNLNHGFEENQKENEDKTVKNSDYALNLSPEEKRKAKLKILKNMFSVSFGFLLLFTAFQSLSNLQSSINSVEGLGTASLSVIYAALIISCMFVPSYMIARFGCKYTMVISILLYSTYFAANFYAEWYTLIPTSVILGLGGAPLWSAKCTYLTEIAKQYAELVGESSEAVVTKFFGFFFMMFQSSHIWGNLIAAYILKPNQNVDDVESNAEILAMCGINFCNAESQTNGNETNKNLDRPSDVKVYTLSGVFLLCALLSAAFIFFVLDQLKRTGQEEEGIKKGAAKPSLKLLIETFKHMKNLNQILIIPLTIYSGVEQGFILSDFTKAYVSCAWGIHNVGMVMICFGLSNALASISYGQLVKMFGRIPIFIFGALIHVLLAITLFHWAPNQSDKALFFVIAGLWGLGDAVWQTQINSLYGVVFADNEEAAFSNYRLWESIGFIIVFAINNFICISTKLYILLTFLALGMLGYAAVEVQIRRKK